MAKKPTVTTVSSGYASNTQLNNNFTAVRDAFDNTLSLDGSTPNAMQADLDLNGNALLNVGNIDADNLTLNGQTVTELSSVPEWRSAWLTGTSYAKNDLVSEAGSAYICLVAHTSGTFSTDLTALKWELFAQKGAAGTGTGDMVGSNNLSDVTNVATARSNLGVQAADATLTALAAYNTNGLVTQTGVDTFTGRTITGTAGLISVTNGNGVSGNPTVTIANGTEGQIIRAGSSTPAFGAQVNQGAAVATTSGTTVDLTGIPSWARRVIVTLSGVSLSGTSYLELRLGDSGGIEGSGYAAASLTAYGGTTSSLIASITGFPVYDNSRTSSASVWRGMFTLINHDGNTWLCTGVFFDNDSTGAITTTSGEKTLSSTLDRVRLTSFNGTDTFDAGSVNILWE